MRKIIIIKNKKTNKLTVKIVSIDDIDIINGNVFIFTNKGVRIIFRDDSDYLIQNFKGNSLGIFYKNFVSNRPVYF